MGPGETTMRSGWSRSTVVNRDLIVASNLDLRTELTQILDEVVGKRVVVIEHEDHKDHFDTGRWWLGRVSSVPDSCYSTLFA